MQRIRILAIVAALSASAPVEAAFVLAGGAVGSSRIPGGIRLTLDSGAVAEVTAVEAGVVRVRLLPDPADRRDGSVARDPAGLPPFQPTVIESGGATWLVTGELKAQVIDNPFRVVVFDKANNVITADAPVAYAFDRDAGTVMNFRFAPQDEAYFGLGERGGPINRRGRVIYMRNTDQFAWGEFTDPHYQSYPLYYALRNGRAHGVFLDSEAFSFFGMDPNGDGSLFFGVERGELDYYIIAGPAPADIALRYARLTGFTPLPPLWTLGYHHSRFGWTSAAEMLDIARRFRAERYPADAIWFDIPHMDRLRKSTWDPTGFPDPLSLHAALKALGFRNVYINEPCVMRDDPLWTFLDSSGFFVKDSSGASLVTPIFLGDASWIDFSLSAAANWVKQQLKVWLSLGIDAVWNDLNEPAANDMPGAVYAFDGSPRSDQRARNVYALLENRTTSQALRELRPDARPWILSRSGSAGAQRYAATWSGDSLSTFDALRVAIQMSISMGLSGQGMFGHDVGGFLGSPDGELFLRWLEFACFTPFVRNHSINTSAPREPWLFPAPFDAMIRARLEERYRMAPYIYTLLAATAAAAQPVVAPTLYYFPQDANTYAQDSAYMFGPDLLVAPIFTRGAASRDVYLPAGVNWVNTDTGQARAGGQVVSAPAPLSVIPVFAREGAVVVRGPVRQHMRDGTPPNRFADVYGGSGGSFTLYEDDGETVAYTRGAFLRTRVVHERTAGAWRVAIERIEGAFDPGPRSWEVRLHGVDVKPSSARLNGAPLAEAASRAGLESAASGWWWDAANQTVVVKGPDTGAAMTFEVALTN